jgi:hypothetical protein
MSEQEQVALWYMRYLRPDYFLCKNEADAAGMAVGIAENGEASVVGVQFPDGTLIELENWPAYEEALRRASEDDERRRAEQAVAPRPAMREIRDPFRGRTLEVPPDSPSWLGAQSVQEAVREKLERDEQR